MDFELCVIGTALDDPATMIEAEDLLPSDFTGFRKDVWETMLTLNRKGILTPAALEASLTTSDTGRLINDALTAKGGNMAELARMVIDASIRRALKRSAALIATTAQDENVPMEEVMDYAEKQILALRRDKKDGVSLGDMLAILIPRTMDARAGTFVPAWTPKLTAVRLIVPSVEDTDLVVIGGRPGDGKSSYLRFEAYHSAMLGKGVVIFNYDNDPIDYARSLITLRCGLSNEKLKNPKLMSDAEMNMVKNTAHELYSLPIYIESKHGDVDWLKRTARFYAAQKKVGLIVVDYIQQIRNSDKDSRNDDVGRTMSALREINFTLNLPILAASQLNREIERRSGSTPMLADLRDSGSLEQDPTVIMFPRTTWTDPTQAEITSFPENVDPRTHRAYPQLKAIPIEFHVKKNRNGPTGVSEVVKWNKSTGQYGTLENNSR